MKVGDKVRFVNEVGGGVVSGFHGKDIVLVEDDDGFEIPMLCKEVVVIDDTVGENNIPRPPIRAGHSKEEDAVLEEHRVVSKSAPRERRGGDALNVYLGFIQPAVDANLFQCYLVNDSNYHLQVSLLSYENAGCLCRFTGVLEPNTKRMAVEFGLAGLNGMERLCVQLLASKADKAFLPKPAHSVELRLDMVKFYKPHAFRPCPFFKAPALLVDVVRDDKPLGRR